MKLFAELRDIVVGESVDRMRKPDVISLSDTTNKFVTSLADSKRVKLPEKLEILVSRCGCRFPFAKYVENGDKVRVVIAETEINDNR